MRSHAVVRVLIASFALAWSSGQRTPAQCALAWVPSQGLVGSSDVLRAATTWDPDGAGPAAPRLVVGGYTTVVGGAIANGIAARDPGTGQWSALGAGTNGTVSALLALPNGELIAAGTFSTAGGVAAANVARWNGTSWSALGFGLGSTVTATCRSPNGDVVAGGWFAGGIARWNGMSWSPLGGGVAATAGPARVLSLQVMPNGDLVAGGVFTSAGGVPASGIARWNGVAWAALPGLSVAECSALGVLPNGHVI